MSLLADSLHLATADALHSNHLERARILLAIALRAEISDEEARLSAALGGGTAARPASGVGSADERLLLDSWESRKIDAGS